MSLGGVLKQSVCLQGMGNRGLPPKPAALGKGMAEVESVGTGNRSGVVFIGGEPAARGPSKPHYERYSNLHYQRQGRSKCLQPCLSLLERFHN